MDKSFSEENGQPVDFDYIVKTVQVSPEGIKAKFLKTFLTYLIYIFVVKKTTKNVKFISKTNILI